MHEKPPPWILIGRYRNMLLDIERSLRTQALIGNGSSALCQKALVEGLEPNSRDFSPISESGAEEMSVRTIELKGLWRSLVVFTRSRKAKSA